MHQSLAYDTYYHLYNRGNNRENLFRVPEDYRRFLKGLAHYLPPVADVFAYCLLPNHFHLLIRTKSVAEQERSHELETPFVPQSPSRAFANLFTSHAKFMNFRYQRSGSLFERPFERKAIYHFAYFKRVLVYIHQNPQRHGLIDDFREWPYSSYNTILLEQPTRLERDLVLEWFSGQSGFCDVHQAWVEDF